MENHRDLPEILTHIDPTELSYEEWLSVGQALHHSGLDVSVWDEWSRRDGARYHDGECAAKWRGFRGSASPVTSGSIIALAKKQGWNPPSGHEIGWEDEISRDEDAGVIVRKEWLQDEEVRPPLHFDPVKEIRTYLETLFDAEEHVGYVTECWQKDDGTYIPTKGSYDRTAGELIRKLDGCGGDIGAVFGDVKPEVGAWIRFNPLDGKDVRDENVTSYRYALVECDTLPVGRQLALIHQLELPVAVMVHSGKKSLHAVIRVDAISYEEYRKRVDYLYSVCRKNGLELDRQNRNPSRLSRMPGVMRDGRPQYIVERGTGKESWEAWKEFIESANDDLPDEEELADVLSRLPELAPQLIEGVLRRGHKMLLAGPSKAGKSFALIELCIAIAEGMPWIGFPCAQGRVLYVNLELDRASCLHRFADVYDALGVANRHPENITIWNLRGHSAPMDKLAPKLIRRAGKKHYDAVIIDPIYKVITGDENSADQMAAFCNQFDTVATQLGCCVIYCHHHSKGGQGQKRSMDRASGSGVFARDPDALLDLIELPLNEDLRKQNENNAVAAECLKWMQRFYPKDWAELVSQDDRCSHSAMAAICHDKLPEAARARLEERLTAVRDKVSKRTAWRVEGTLREFAPFAPRNLWFDYPTHHIDESGALADVKPEEERPFGTKHARTKGTKNNAENAEKRRTEFDNAVALCGGGEPPTVQALYDYYGGKVEKAALYKRLSRYGYRLDKATGEISRKED